MAQNKDYDQSIQTPPTATSLNYSADHEYGGSSGFQTGSTYKSSRCSTGSKDGHGLNETVNGTPHSINPGRSAGRRLHRLRPEERLGGRSRQLHRRPRNGAVGERRVRLDGSKLDLCDIKQTAQDLGVHPADEKPSSTPYPSSILGSEHHRPADDGVGVRDDRERRHVLQADRDRQHHRAGRQEPRRPAEGVQAGARPERRRHRRVRACRAPSSAAPRSARRRRTARTLFAKTGTTDDADQIWLVGGSSKVATAYWQGNRDGGEEQPPSLLQRGRDGTYARPAPRSGARR